ncbi:MAG: N-acetyl-gamma-glutamyl-phosphate reductase [Candidatus Solincola sediminis]|nr:MAG: N-acetyl-gamma-glutamyl-phosphate reductase [Candidatus Solincola sediminis]
MRIGIVGASGYTGVELLRLLHCHPHAQVTYITAHTYAGKPVGEVYPHLHPYANSVFRKFSVSEALEEADFFFIALPHGEAMVAVSSLLEGDCRVCDLSADYRFSDPKTYENWYQVEHSSPKLLQEAVYGLAEINRDAIRDTRLVAVPGCYPTASILALAPVMNQIPANGTSIIIDAKSGLSGAGRALSLPTHFAQADENMKPYNVGSHRHTPEIEEVLSSLRGEKASVVFTPHLIPMNRGILATCYAKLGEGISTDAIEPLYRSCYKGSEFIVIRGEGDFPETKAVSGTNYCHIGWHFDDDSRLLIVASAIDNLVKGASGQAIQCMNIMNDWDEATGLESLGIFP